MMSTIFFDESLIEAHGAHHLPHHFAAFDRHFGRARCQLIGLLGVLCVLLHRRGKLFHRGGRLFQA